MPSLTVRPDEAGYYSGWTSLFPATRAKGWTTVDDGSANDDTDYLILPRLVSPAGAASFSFGSASNILPTQIVITCRAKIETGVAPELRVGFANKRTGDVAVDGTTEVMVSGYATFARTFTTNPFTSAAWAVDEMKNMELYVSTVIGVLGTARVTLLNAAVTYTLPTNYGIKPEPQVYQTG